MRRPSKRSAGARKTKAEIPEAVRVLALDVHRTAETAGLSAYRFSGSFAAPTLESARAALALGADAAASVGGAFFGGVDRRAEPDRLGRDAHLYAIIVAHSRSEAEAVRDAAMRTLQSSRRGWKLDALGFGAAATIEHYELTVAYALKPWPKAAGARDPERDIRASGSLLLVWQRHRDAVLSTLSPKACGHCGAALDPRHPRRRTSTGPDGTPVAGYCSKSCRQKACRRRAKYLAELATEAIDFDPDLAGAVAYVRSVAPTVSAKDAERAARTALALALNTPTKEKRSCPDSHPSKT